MRAPRLQTLAGWALALALAAYIAWAAENWDVPRPGGQDFPRLWLLLTAFALGCWRLLHRPLTSVAAIAIGALVAMVLTDVSYLWSQGLRDLHLYLRAGELFAAGAPVYLEAVLTERPADLTLYPYLYPPPTLPMLAALAALPRPVVDVVWVGLAVAAAVATLRLFGLRWRWALLLLLWPPVFQGIQVGNVSVFTSLLFAAAPWVGAGLVVAAVFKVYSGVPALWLVRERRLRPIAAGLAVVAVWSLVTLPLTGTDRWIEWWRGLDLFRASQPHLPHSLYGFGLPLYMPPLVALGAGAAVTLAALVVPGREGLARLGLATVVIAPSLYAHGLIVALPAFLGLRSIVLWTVLAITSVAPGTGWWIAIGMGLLAWVVPALRSDAGEDVLHPLADARAASKTSPGVDSAGSPAIA